MKNIRLLLKQHIGAPCVSLVKQGDLVKKGTLIAQPQGLGANIFSSVYGKVNDVTDSYIEIIPDQVQKEEYEQLQGETPMELLKNSGIVGMGGAGFPTHIKLSADLKGGYVLINAAECEPGLKHNILQLENNGEKTLRGVKYIMEMVNAEKAVFAIKAKNTQAVDNLKNLLKTEENIELFLMPDIYPMGEERAVVREVLGVLLEPTQLPLEAQAVVINAETVLRVCEAIEDKKPCFSKNLTVTGKVKEPQVFFDVPIGTSVCELIEKAGGTEGVIGEIIMGGAFTGRSVDLNEPITKTTGAIIPTVEFPDLHGAKTGILLCACGGNEQRMREIAVKMHGEVISVQKCKQAVEIKGTLKCENPGNCPGQAQKCLAMKKDGCEYIIIGNCSDCSNTVMGSAPKMGLKIFHQTDHVMRSIHHKLYRKMTESKKI